MTTLLGLPYSPWSEKARFALEVRRVPFRYRHYQPLLGEPSLRLATRQWTGPVSVPVLFDDAGRPVCGSTAIARWADGQGEGAELFPSEHASAVDDFAERSERALARGRTISLRRMLEDREALDEMVPRPLRAVLGPVGTAIGKAGVARTIRKYALGDGPEDDRRVLTSELESLRAALATDAARRTDPATLVGVFSFADIAMSAVLAFVSPPSFGLKIGRASRRSFSDPELAERYADLLEWRDALYEAHRPRTK